MNERVILPYGSWPSPVTAADSAQGTVRLGFPSVAAGEIWWEETRPDEGGRTTVMHLAPDGTVTDLLPAPWNARTRVHEYGGRSYLPVPRRDDKALTRWGIVFANFSDQRLYLLEKGSREPRPLTPEPASPGALRYADPVLAPDRKHLICVQESHDGAAVTRSIVSIPLSGRASHTPSAVRTLVTGADFFASPVPSPDGTKLAWISWDSPRMPWTGTQLRVAALPGSGPVTASRVLRGGIKESVLHPRWRDDDTLYFVSDWSGWWNLYETRVQGQALALYPDEAEFTPPPWQLGTTPYCVLDNGRIVTLRGHADLTVSAYDPATADLTPLTTPYTTWQDLASDGTTVVGVASSPTEPTSLVRLNPDTGATTVLRRPLDTPPTVDYLPRPEATTLSGRYGTTVHANVYPPTNPAIEDEGPAPYVVWVHGGPTGAATAAFDLHKAYFTSRGIGIIDVNYGGSTGYGRSYRERLNGQWGVVDVEDAIAAAQALVDKGLADPTRLAIRGGSAGGLTTLLALTHGVFACGVSYYGVTDLLRLAQETHDFESRYLDTIIGALPGYTSTYRERSPINRAAEITSPVLLLQGTEDPVVPVSQARELAAVLRDRKIPHALVEFEGESHGFRRTDTVTTALEKELAFYCKVFFGFTPPGVPPIELVTPEGDS
ncbi:S9 family peptidase [Thermobifida cellulosilytica]|uniref:Peptidase S9 n=1 Tax=Thermobifida cellulosilytica TB100 TaxID=665004 RepID=A0A147KMI0_THECS|nr:prolyl oligopeptidase family serine peptidase [Thermobifida cellulosilytica]KUP98459.1 peptidase S9 [Thermobifida cellulosilytica TB100]